METTAAAPGNEPRRKDRRLPLIELARACLAEADGDEEAASDLLCDKVLADTTYVEEICVLIIHRIAQDDKDTKASTSRSRAQSTVNPAEAAKKGAEAVSALARVVGRSLLDFKLPNKMPILREATAAQIAEALKHYRKTVHTMTVRMHWLDSISKKLKPGQKVGEVIDELTARRMFETSEKLNAL